MFKEYSSAQDGSSWQIVCFFFRT